MSVRSAGQRDEVRPMVWPSESEVDGTIIAFPRPRSWAALGTAPSTEEGVAPEALAGREAAGAAQTPQPVGTAGSSPQLSAQPPQAEQAAADGAPSGFGLFKNVAPDQIAPFLSHEHPQTIALILSQLDPRQAAGILAQLPEQMQSDVVYRIATMENITPAVIRQIEESLESSLRDILGGNLVVGGPKVVADILNMAGSSVEKNVLAQMDAQDGQVAEAVRNLMFVFDDIAKLTDREIQTLLREVDQKDLVVALKAGSEEVKNKILANVSEQVRKFLTEEMEFLGPMRLSEVEAVQLRIVQQVRQLEEQGNITIVRGDACDVFV